MTYFGLCIFLRRRLNGRAQKWRAAVLFISIIFRRAASNGSPIWGNMQFVVVRARPVQLRYKAEEPFVSGESNRSTLVWPVVNTFRYLSWCSGVALGSRRHGIGVCGVIGIV